MIRYCTGCTACWEQAQDQPHRGQSLRLQHAAATGPVANGAPACERVQDTAIHSYYWFVLFIF